MDDHIDDDPDYAKPTSNIRDDEVDQDGNDDDGEDYLGDYVGDNRCCI